MRIALLSILDRDPAPGRTRPAFLPFAGARVVERQLDLALSLGCEAIACLADGIGREVIELQHRAERAGARFIAIREPGKLSGLVTANDELLVIASGVLPDPTLVEKLLAKPGVIAFPADVAVPLGFERIDPEFAWTGVVLTRGNLVERLTELPSDIDVPSSLMRLALQTGAQLVPAERRVLDDGDWTIDANPEELKARETRWIEAQREKIPFTAPGIAVAERAGTRLARDIVGKKSETAPAVVAAVFALAAAFSAWLDLPVLGFGFLATSAFFSRVALVIERVARKGDARANRGSFVKYLQYLHDPLIIFLMYVASSQESDWVRLFVPAMLVGLLRLGEWHGSETWRRTYADRILLGGILCGAAFFGLAAEVGAFLALLVLVSRFLTAFRQP